MKPKRGGWPAVNVNDRMGRTEFQTITSMAWKGRVSALPDAQVYRAAMEAAPCHVVVHESDDKGTIYRIGDVLFEVSLPG